MTKYAWIVLIVILLIIIIFESSKKTSKQIISEPTPTIISSPKFIIKPTQFITPSPTISPSIDCQTGSDIRNAKCPPGCVYYGMPLGCVTQSYYDNCRKNHNCPICLSSSTSIETKKGNVNVKNLKVGMLVLTINKLGKKELQPVLKLSSAEVGPHQDLVHLTLSDKRELFVSPNHPTVINIPVGSLTIGKIYDGAIITSLNLVSYSDTKTYDLLPAGDTGFYFANGIPLGSTLK